ncbi:MAG: phosphoribosylformylglycinamidine cyclo-ligase, partial [Saprospiraceae bacterium]
YEMYQVFNMGHRLECYVSDLSAAEHMVAIAAGFDIEAKIIGKVDRSNGKEITIIHGEEKIHYQY